MAGAKQIVAMGGGMLSMEGDELRLEKYVFGLTGKENPKVCYLGTASGDSQMGIDRFYDACAHLPCTPTHLSLFKPSTRDLAGLLLAQDVLLIGGGNTRNLLALWRLWEVDAIMRAAWERGIVLAGASAGSICWFESGTTDSWFGPLSALPCLGFLPGSNSPHYDSEPERRPSYHHFIASGEMADGYAADDGVAFHFTGTTLAKVISARPNARAYRVERRGDHVTETEIVPEFLGD